jgi:hypothetical protein
MELEIAVSNGSVEGLSKGAIMKVEKLKEDKMTQVLAFAGSMSLDSNSAARPSENKMESQVMETDVSRNESF